MTAQKESVVTPERLSQGINYKQWMEQIDRNQEKFVDNFEGTQLNADDVAAIKALMAKDGGPATCMAIGEPWCPDVFRGMPVIAKLCEATGLDLKIFFRDQHIDLMNEYLYKGEFQSIPTLVFFTKDHKELGVWHERAQKARDEMPQLSEITAKMRNQELSEEERQKHMDQYAAFQKGPVWGGWRDAEVKEIRTLLEAAVR
ncbi:MAG TPA: thioredoxin family protein [Dehalococcoidia bacterium]|jgi:thiol-disulfide isomerase/thioredoxin|nr:thioredoxin family protein [Dehalococcoidia bacterium]